MADWGELKRLAEEAAELSGWFDDIDELGFCEDESAFIVAAAPAAILALIAENEEQAERLRVFELIHGGRASDLASEMHALRAEVRRLKIAAGEPVPPLPEEFVGPRPELCADRIRRKINEQAGPPVIPANLNGLAGAAFAMADRGEDPSDMLAMLQAGLKKAQPQWSEQKARTVDAMCMTWRHDFGLEKREHDFGSCGMTDAEREALRAQMGQLYEHHIAPVIAESERLREDVKDHADARAHYCGKVGEIAGERDHLKAESERLGHLACAMNSAMHAAGMPVDAGPAELADVIHKLQVKAANESQAARYWKKRFDEDTTEAIDQLKAENARLRNAVQEVAGLVDGDLRELARDLVNAFSGLKNGTNPNDIYGCCDKIDQVIAAALSKESDA